MIIDTHCHLEVEDYVSLDEVIEKMDGNIMIVSGVDNSTNHGVIELCNKNKNIYGTIGIHPEFANISHTELSKALNYIEENIKNPKIVGIGEIGLDYHYIYNNKQQQKEIFIKQLDLARKYKKAVVIHSRDSINDTYEILKNYKDLKKTIHCFSSSLEMAKKFIGINCLLGIGGVLTFKNSEKLKQIVKELDLKNFVLETDSPYLSPEPFRGQKNEPCNVIYVAKKIAEIKQISLDKVIEVTTYNACYQFDLDVGI